MNITHTVKLTTIRYTSPPYEAPTIEIAVTAPKGATPSSLVGYHKSAHMNLMASAHLMASTLWAQNVADHEIAIAPQGNGVVWVTMDVGRDDAEQGKALDFMRRILPAPESPVPAKPKRVSLQA